MGIELFLVKNFLLFQEICVTAVHVRENDLYKSVKDYFVNSWRDWEFRFGFLGFGKQIVKKEVKYGNML